MQTNKIVGLVMATTALFASAIIVHAAMLDGTKLKVKMVPDKAAADKGEKEFEDELIFADGKFTSTALLRKGFKPSKYRGEFEEKEAEFEVEQLSETNGVANWQGEIRGTNAVGRLKWKQKDGSYLSYEFNGTKE